MDVTGRPLSPLDARCKVLAKMIGRFAIDPERACYTIWTIWAVSWFLVAGWSSRAQSRASLAQQLPYRLLTISGFILLFAVRTNRYHGPLRIWTLPVSAGWAMVLLCCDGLWLRLVGATPSRSALVRLCDSQSGSPDCRYRALSCRAPSHLYGDSRGGDRAGARQRNGDSICWRVVGRVWLLGEGAAGRRLLERTARSRDLRFLSPPRADACAIRPTLKR
jgi:hypothetical protein